MGAEYEVADAPDSWPVLATSVVHHGRVFDLRRDQVEGPNGPMTREYLDHPGAVGVVVLDENDQVLLLRQYRHPVRRQLWEVPAGLLDVAGEDAQAAAARELAEEADLQAGTWHTLVDFFTSSGCSDEAIRIFLARDLTPVPEGQRHTRTDEEAGIVLRWVPLEDAVDAALAGRLHNTAAVVGVLAAHAARATGWDRLRSPGDAWPDRKRS